MRAVYGIVHTMEHQTSIHVIQVMILLSFAIVDYTFIYLGIIHYLIVNVTPPVSCEPGDIHLVGGAKDYEGRLEVCINQL